MVTAVKIRFQRFISFFKTWNRNESGILSVRIRYNRQYLILCKTKMTFVKTGYDLFFNNHLLLFVCCVEAVRIWVYISGASDIVIVAFFPPHQSKFFILKNIHHFLRTVQQEVQFSWRPPSVPSRSWQASRGQRPTGGPVQPVPGPPRPGGLLPEVSAELCGQSVRPLHGLWGFLETPVPLYVTGYKRTTSVRDTQQPQTR